jgi:hypothetical protein
METDGTTPRDTRFWLAALAAALVLGVGLGGCRSSGGAAPPGLDEDTTLIAVLIQGEKAMTSPEGIRVMAVRGSWVKLGVGKADKAGRWINFEHVSGYSAKLED